jgi:hypothetical protein
MLDVRLGSPQQHQHLTIYPLLTPTEQELSCLLLIEAINASLVEITEKGSGQVPTLIAQNKGDDAVLILDGEQLIGARQNRMTNRSILLPPRSETEIPVFCMEQGRWRHASHAMSPKEYVSPTKVRKHARKVEAEHSMRGANASLEMLSTAQGDVWREIAKVSEQMGSYSDTGALDHTYDDNVRRIEDWLPSFPGVPDQVGLLAFVANRPIGLDLIGGGALYGRVHQRFLYGYVVDAMTTEVSATSSSEVTAEEYLHRVRTALKTEAPTTGSGKYAVLSGNVVGGELSADVQVIHLSAFPNDDRGNRELVERPVLGESPLARPSIRKRT